MENLIRSLIAAVIFAALGIGVLTGSLWLLARLAPWTLREIEEDHNTALAIIVGSAAIGISIIIAAAIHG
jgi:uncharacterized membrane protein YjfL (UPF0719 family)